MLLHHLSYQVAPRPGVFPHRRVNYRSHDTAIGGAASKDWLQNSNETCSARIVIHGVIGDFVRGRAGGGRGTYEGLAPHSRQSCSSCSKSLTTDDATQRSETFSCLQSVDDCSWIFI